MVYLGYCTKTDKYLFAIDGAKLSSNGVLEIQASSEVQAIERARQVVFGMA
jgi:hypothetical protein